MNIQVTIIGDEEYVQDMRRFGEAFPRILNTMLRYAANKFVAHARKTMGQYLKVSRQSKAWKQLKVRTTKDHRPHSYVVIGNLLSNIYEHPGGATIRPKKKQSVAWGGPRGGPHPHHAQAVHLDRRPFMSAAQNTFNFDGATNEAITTIMDRELRRRGFI
ncbi:MAG TPA: hypothetical protein VM223_21085 [Planctomycetota bacterium]|nr:hypothetical protein [Planctomycetota bacterium]